MRDLDGAPPSTTGAPRCQTIPEMRPVVLSGCAASDSAWGRRTLALVFQLNKSNNKNKKNNK